MTAPWPPPQRPEQSPDLRRLELVQQRLEAAELRMAELEQQPDLAGTFLRGFARGFVVVLLLALVVLA